MLNQDQQIKNFNQVGNTPEVWQICAEELLISSRLLFDNYSKIDFQGLAVGDPIPPEGRIFSVVKMLRAMALECFFKALWLKGDGHLAINGKYAKIPETDDHNLISLADKVSEKFDLNVTNDERHLLNRLSLSIAGGRYPIQQTWELAKIRSLPGGGKGSPTYWKFPIDEELFTSLVTRLIHTLEGTRDI